MRRRSKFHCSLTFHYQGSKYHQALIVLYIPHCKSNQYFSQILLTMHIFLFFTSVTNPRQESHHHVLHVTKKFKASHMSSDGICGTGVICILFQECYQVMEAVHGILNMGHGPSLIIYVVPGQCMKFSKEQCLKRKVTKAF